MCNDKEYISTRCRDLSAFLQNHMIANNYGFHSISILHFVAKHFSNIIISFIDHKVPGSPYICQITIECILSTVLLNKESLNTNN